MRSSNGPCDSTVSDSSLKLNRPESVLEPHGFSSITRMRSISSSFTRCDARTSYRRHSPRLALRGQFVCRSSSQRHQNRSHSAQILRTCMRYASFRIEANGPFFSSTSRMVLSKNSCIRSASSFLYLICKHMYQAMIESATHQTREEAWVIVLRQCIELASTHKPDNTTPSNTQQPNIKQTRGTPCLQPEAPTCAQ